MLSIRLLQRMDFRIIPVIAMLMGIGVLIISSFSMEHPLEGADETFFTPTVVKQIKFIVIGWVFYFTAALFDYNRLREWTWFLYALMLAALVGLFFTGAIQGVHRWYRLPGLGMNFQPSEYAKLVVVISLSWFLERNHERSMDLSTAIKGCLIVGIPFILILKEPDLGTALVLVPITLVMFYFGNIHPLVIRVLTGASLAGLLMSVLFLTGVLSHDELRPVVTKFIKEYQYERLSPNVPHQKASQMAIAIGGWAGTGWRKSEYTAGGWLPTPYTDSVFPAFGEEFGLVGLIFLLFLFYLLLYFSFQVTTMAKDHFGRLLAAGISVYLAMHVVVNVGMMCGLLPITGVPLILVTYGGTSLISTMTSLGLLQSICSRRYMF